MRQRPKKSRATSAMRRFIIVGVKVVSVLKTSRTMSVGMTAIIE